ncbi:MAG: serine/threonine protein kinase [Acidimicrobiia bacterium]|nr:serine/threonine protein kinase [Acidimicrobiia bacterium]
MTLSRGERLGPYRILEPVGVGGFAVVYRAVDDRFDTEVAIKVLADNHALDPDVRVRFVDEARKLRKVHHPGIVQVYDIGETPGGQPYLVLEYAAGGDLAARWHAQGPRDRSELRALALWIGGVLGVVHDAGLVHRDLKPQNILVASTTNGSDRLVLADLGFAKDLELASGITVGGRNRSLCCARAAIQRQLCRCEGRRLQRLCRHHLGCHRGSSWQ